MTGQVGHEAFGVQRRRDFRLRSTLHHKHTVEAPNHRDLFGRPRFEDDTVRLEAFVLAPSQFGLSYAAFINKLASKPVTGGSTLPKTQADEPTLTIEDLH
jgi:hypothetical protein